MPFATNSRPLSGSVQPQVELPVRICESEPGEPAVAWLMKSYRSMFLHLKVWRGSPGIASA